jgi:hypothetical protein
MSQHNPYQPPAPPGATGYTPAPFGAPYCPPPPFGAPFGAPAPFGAAAPFGSAGAGYSPQGQAEMLRQWAERDLAVYSKFAVIGGIVSFIFFGFLFGWISVYRGSRALTLIKQHDIGHQHAGTAKIGLALGIASIVTWVLGFAYLIIAA